MTWEGKARMKPMLTTLLYFLWLALETERKHTHAHSIPVLTSMSVSHEREKQEWSPCSQHFCTFLHGFTTWERGKTTDAHYISVGFNSSVTKERKRKRGRRGKRGKRGRSNTRAHNISEHAMKWEKKEHTLYFNVCVTSETEKKKKRERKKSISVPISDLLMMWEEN